MSETVIRVEGLYKIYHEGKPEEVRAINGVDLSVEQGEMVAIMGTSGSGKSSMMNVIGCLDRPTRGAYYLDGVRVDNLSKDDLADFRNT
jgi:putative ABC transport system ATP-binding protein